MNNANTERKLIRRRIVYIALTALVLLGGGTLGWYYLANQISKWADDQIAVLASQGKIVECANQTVRGYPFRAGLFCDRIGYGDNAAGIQFNSGALRTAAQFYQPGFAVSEMDGPAQLKLPDEELLNITWKLVRTSTRISLGGLKRISLNFDDVKISQESAGDLVALKQMELHLRPGDSDTGSPDIDAALDLKELRFGKILLEDRPALNVYFDGRLSEMNTILKSGHALRNWVQANGLDVQIRKFELASNGGGSFAVSGPLHIGKSGLISGKFNIEVQDLQKIVAEFNAQNPQLGESAQTIETVSAMISQGSKDGKLRLSIQVKNGVATMGFIPLGNIPPIF